MISKQILTAGITTTILFTSTGPVDAEVLDSAPGGFTIMHKMNVLANRIEVYEAVVGNVGDWWSDDHTLSGDAANMYIEAKPQGCFCEALGEGAGVVHLTVTFVNPGVIVRLTGGLGPLGLMGVTGNMTWEFEDTEQGSAVTLTYAVGGYLADGLDSIAEAVDRVLIEQMTSLKAFVEDNVGEL